jgi:hypothetical protein
MQKVPYCFPIIGGRKVEHLLSNIESFDISLSSEQIAFLEGVLPFDPGFPTTMIVRLACFLCAALFINLLQGDGTKPSFLMASATFVKQPRVEPIRPSKI